MVERVTIGAGDLRRAVADERYWNSSHPERMAFVDWVTDGFRALHGPEARGGTVQVRAYTRMREGRIHQVGAHARGAPPGGGGGTGGPIQRAQAPFFLFTRPPVVPPGARVPMRRIPRQSGKEAADNIPSWAEGARRFVGEAPQDFARRVMDGRWGRGNWQGNKDRQREFNQIKKFGQRGFEMPTVPFLLGTDGEA